MDASTANKIDRLRELVGEDGVIDNATALSTYDCDGYTLEKSTPDIVVLPLNRGNGRRCQIPASRENLLRAARCGDGLERRLSAN